MKNITKILIFIVLIGLFSSCDKTGQFRNGMANVKDFTTGKYGYVNENKNIVIEKKYDWAGDFYSNFAVVELNKKRGLINKKGQIIIPLKYDNVMHLENNYFKVTDNGKTGVFNSYNQEIIPTVALYVDKMHNNKYFEVKLNSDENSVCLFNTKGEKVTEAKFSEVFLIKENYAIMRKNLGKSSYTIDNFSYKIHDLENINNPINKLPIYRYAGLINESDVNTNLLFQVKNYSETSIVNYRGQTIIPFGKYDYIWNFGENLFSVSVKGMRSGYADKNGNLVIKPMFNNTEKFENGIAKVTLKEKTFYIDKNGNCKKDCPTQKWLDYHKISGFRINNSLYKQLVKKGLQESKSENYLKSVETFSNAIKENPIDYEAYYNRGLSYLMLKELDNAERDFDKSIHYNPSYSNSYYLRGNVHQKKGNSYSAISDFEKAIELNPYNSDSYMKCAIVYGKQGDKKKSCEYMKKACELGNYDACSGYSRFCE